MSRKLASATISLALAASTVALATPAEAKPRGNQSLAAVLAADGSGFDRTANDFDVLDNAVNAVLAAKPNSPVKILTQGRKKLTAFAPTDGAFRGFTEDLTGKRYKSERRVFNRLAAVAGIDTVEAVLLYHVLPGAIVNYRTAKHSDGAELTMADGGTVTVKVRHENRVVLRDADKNDPNARVRPALKNINAGNKQIAHGIGRVLRPSDL